MQLVSTNNCCLLVSPPAVFTENVTLEVVKVGITLPAVESHHMTIWHQWEGLGMPTVTISCYIVDGRV